MMVNCNTIMKRDALALLLHPYKNGLVPRSLLKESIGRFFTELFSLQQHYPQFRFNLVIPGYILEAADPLQLAQLRDLGKRNIVELVCTGYTEPFLSFSPPDLTVNNIRYGLQVIEELTGLVPRGFLPPFSNWEPSFIAELRAAGMRYVLLSNELFTDETRSACGYWVTEHAGSSIGLIGTNELTPLSFQGNFIENLRSVFAKNSAPATDPFTVLHYLLPLCSPKTDDSHQFLKFTIEEIEKHLLNFQPVCLSDILGNVSPVGMQYIPTSLQIGRRGAVDLHFLNYLFSFDQIGFLQRKLLDIFDRLPAQQEDRFSSPLLHDLYFIQDINRLLPGNESGFEVAADRETTYARLIAIDREIDAEHKSDGGSVDINDFLHNGGKTVTISNSAVKVFVSHLVGGQIIGFDLRKACVNLCSVYNPDRRKQPDIIVPNASRTWFLDRILPETIPLDNHRALLTADAADFHSGAFDYKLHTTPNGINISLGRTGSCQRGDRLYPLRIEKVFGIEREHSGIIFVYQLSNLSLMEFKCTFATELNLYFPGCSTDRVCLIAEKNRYDHPGRQFLCLRKLTAWEFNDRLSGLQLRLQTQKAATLWCLPHPAASATPEGIRIILTWPISLEPSSSFKIIGKIICKSPRREGDSSDAV
jgi:hypothetical protein